MSNITIKNRFFETFYAASYNIFLWKYNNQVIQCIGDERCNNTYRFNISGSQYSVLHFVGDIAYVITSDYDYSSTRVKYPTVECDTLDKIYLALKNVNTLTVTDKYNPWIKHENLVTVCLPKLV